MERCVKLSPQELGAKGEKRFGELCADAGLICNQSDQDVTGWDFIVESPFDPAQAEFESRSSPPAYHVQVKTIWSTSNSIKVRLTSAERLAKEPKPGIVVVLRVDDNLQFIDGHLIHLSGTALAKILKRLRIEDLSPRGRPNHRWLTFSPVRDGTRFEVSGRGLRDALAAVCSDNMDGYIAAKVVEIQQLGYDERPIEVKMSLHVGGMDDLVEAFLGMKSNIPATNIVQHQTRFGVRKKIDLFGESKGSITIEPHRADTCDITVQSSVPGRPVIFKGDVFFPAIPGLPKEHFKIRVETIFFSILISLSTCTVHLRPKSQQNTPSAWSTFWRMLEILTEGSGTVRIAFDSKPNADHLVCGIDTKIGPFERRQCAGAALLADDLAFILDYHGLTGQPELEWAAILDNADRVGTVAALLRGQQTNLTLSMDVAVDGPLPDVGEIDFDLVDFLSVGEICLGYSARGKGSMTSRASRVSCRLTDMALVSSRVLRNPMLEFDSFANEAKRAGVSGSYVRRPMELIS